MLGVVPQTVPREGPVSGGISGASRPLAGSDGTEVIACYRTVALRSACVTLPRTIALWSSRPGC